MRDALHDLPLDDLAARIAMGRFTPEKRARFLEECEQLARTILALPEPARFRLELYSGSLRCGEREIPVGERSFEVLAALALRGEASREELTDLLWPDLDPHAAANALKMCVHRIRTAARCKDLIESTKSGYRLGREAAVDTREVERAFALLSDEKASLELRSELDRVAGRLGASSLGRLGRCEWAGPHVAYLEKLRRDLFFALAREAMERDDLHALDAHVTVLLAFDPCDEEAHELAIESALRAGKREAAQRQYDLYRQALARELDVDDELKLRSLLHAFDAGHKSAA